MTPLPDGAIPAFWPSDGWEPRADFDIWLSRLRENHVTDLVIFSTPSLELHWAKQPPEIFEDAGGATGIGGHYRLRRR